VRLGYFWTDCPDGSHVAVNYAVHEDRVTGSVRRWSRDTRINVGQKFEIFASDIAAGPEGLPAISLSGICSGSMRVPLDPRVLAEAGLSWKTAA
jgi:hypothetical protein